MSDRPGIYVEILIQDELDAIWRLTQEPAHHQRWDLRFSRIEYLPRPDVDEPQRFLYETRIGFGLTIRGTGESIGTHGSAEGDTTSSLRFASADAKSLIREGSGYWRYVPTAAGLRFFTWYDYEVRFGPVGRIANLLIFRPLMGWATAWSFDRLRLWAEEGMTPETTMSLSLIHGVARVSIAAIWLWHGLVPKLLYRDMDEQTMLAQAGLPPGALPWLGGAEVLVGILVLSTWRERRIFLVNAAVMVIATAAVAARSPRYLKTAFNPVTLNLGMIALSVVGWLASRRLPTSRRCLRVPPKGQR